MLSSIIDTYEVYASLLKWEKCSDKHSDKYDVYHTRYNDCTIHKFCIDGSPYINGSKVVFHCISASNAILDKRDSIYMEHLTCRKCRKDTDTCYIFHDLVFLLLNVDYGKDRA